jgi:tRNA modification GTPase
MSTLYALASGAGRAGVAVVRLSGPQAFDALEAVTGRAPPPPRRLALRAIRDPADGELIDRALVVCFPAPESFTGEPVAEMHVHGGPAVIAGLLEALGRLSGLEPAGPGAFSRRAFENGRMDLTQAEAVADLVDAETVGQRRQALRQMDGALGALYEGWRARLISLMARLEAEIDFPDEGDAPRDAAGGLAPEVARLAGELRTHLADHRRGERVRDGYRVVILGAPNAGKSSLLNRMCGVEAAIVSPIPGTTRDIVEARLVLAGFPVWVADTAGLREASDQIEAEGVRRALARAEAADLRVVVVDAAGPPPEGAVAAAMASSSLIAFNKIDQPAAYWVGSAAAAAGGRGFPIAAATGRGVTDLMAAIARRVAEDLGAQEAPALSRARHRHDVETAAGALDRAHSALARAAELAGEDLRLAARALGRVTGRVDVEDILDVVFSSFCIGK